MTDPKILEGSAVRGRFSSALRDTLLIAAMAFVLGSLLNFPIMAKSFNSSLIAEITDRQLSQLKACSLDADTGIRFIGLGPSKKFFDKNQAVFLDTRDPGEFNRSHIAGDLELSPAPTAGVDPPVEYLLPGRKTLFIFYCNTGECDVSMGLDREMTGNGYSNIFVLSEGYPGWEAAGYPVVKGGDEDDRISG